jgi:hypothetical protein
MQELLEVPQEEMLLWSLLIVCLLLLDLILPQVLGYLLLIVELLGLNLLKQGSLIEVCSAPRKLGLMLGKNSSRLSLDLWHSR